MKRTNPIPTLRSIESNERIAMNYVCVAIAHNETGSLGHHYKLYTLLAGAGLTLNFGFSSYLLKKNFKAIEREGSN